MVSSVGKKLQQSRLSKQISIEEAARVTRIRPDKLLDLEEDNYSNFPSMSYAKGFLLIYARFLGVDVREYADSLHAPNPVSSDDYEYLNAASSGPAPPPSRRPYHFSPRRERTLLPVVVFIALAGAVFLAIHLIIVWERLGPSEVASDKEALAEPMESPAISTLPAPAPAAAGHAAPTPALRDAPPALMAASPAPVASGSVPPTAAVDPPVAVPAPTFDPTREVRRAEPVAPTPPAHADASALPEVGSGPALSSIVPPAPSDSLRQLSILPIRKTMVTVRKDVADSTPIFQDWLYPGAGALKVSGHRFWIKVQDRSAVQITQDGQPLPAGQGDVQIE